MFIANEYCDVYREEGDQDYSEYDSVPDSSASLVYKNAPIHITPYRPRYSETAREGGQQTRHVANTRRDIVLMEGDEVRISGGRAFIVKSVELTRGIFTANSIIYELIEHTPDSRTARP